MADLPRVRSEEWVSDLQEAAKRCEVLLWQLAQSGHYVNSKEVYSVAKGLKLAEDLCKMSTDDLAQIGYAAD